MEATVNYDGGDGGASTPSRDKSVIFDDSDSSIFTLGSGGTEYTRPLTRSQLMARVGYEYQH